MFYVNYEPEGKFLYAETIRLYCIVLYSLHARSHDMSLYVSRGLGINGVESTAKGKQQ